MKAITSSATAQELDMVRQRAGVNPVGSKLTHTERLHLLYMAAVLRMADMDPNGGLRARMLRFTLQGLLTERGMNPATVVEIFRAPVIPAKATDTVCVHPELGDFRYLD